MQIQKGRIQLPTDLGSWRRDLLENGLVEIPVNATIAMRAGLLPDMHGDPCDRLIVATNQGVPVIHDRRASSGAAFSRIAARIDGEDVPISEYSIFHEADPPARP